MGFFLAIYKNNRVPKEKKNDFILCLLVFFLCFALHHVHTVRCFFCFCFFFVSKTKPEKKKCQHY